MLISPGRSVGFLCRPNRPGPLHHAAGKGWHQDAGPVVLQLREEGSGGGDRQPDSSSCRPGPLLHHKTPRHPHHQGRVGEHAEGYGGREGQPLWSEFSVYEIYTSG